MDKIPQERYYGAMDYSTFKGLTRRAELGIKDFAELVGLNYRSVSNYAKTGKVPEHLGIIAFMMSELVKHDVNLRDVFRKIDELGRCDRKSQRPGFKGQRKNSGGEGA